MYCLSRASRIRAALDVPQAERGERCFRVESCQWNKPDVGQDRTYAETLHDDRFGPR
jgi:hypothetical protein